MNIHHEKEDIHKIAWNNICMKKYVDISCHGGNVRQSRISSV
jgi:hypothetical protein